MLIADEENAKLSEDSDIVVTAAAYFWLGCALVVAAAARESMFD